MTNNNLKRRIRDYMDVHGVNHTTAKRALADRGTPQSGSQPGSQSATEPWPVAYVRETWPIADNRGTWDGDYVQVAVDCPMCGNQHHHGGYLSDGRDHGHRSSHCSTTPTATSTRGGYVIRDARKAQVVTDTGEFRFTGQWPGDIDPLVDEVERLVEAEQWESVTAILRDPGVAPAVVRSAFDSGYGWDAEATEAGKAAIVVINHPATPDRIRNNAVEEILKDADRDVVLALASTPAVERIGNSLVERDCAGNHDVLLALAANPSTTADTLGWVSEHATGFIHSDVVDEDLARLILRHPNLDSEVWGFFTQRSAHCVPLLLEAPTCDRQTATDILWDAYYDDNLVNAQRAIRFLLDQGDEGKAVVTAWLEEVEDEDTTGWAVDLGREALAQHTAR